MRFHDNTQRLDVVDTYYSYMQANNIKNEIHSCFSIATVVTRNGSNVKLCAHCLSCLLKFTLYKVFDIFELEVVRTSDMIIRVYRQ